MILKFILILLALKVVFCETADPLEVNCPDGWLAQDLAIYSDKRIDEIQLKDKNNFTICLICQRNSVLKSHPFRFVEICFFNLQRLKSTQLEVTSCNALWCDAESSCDVESSSKLKKYQSEKCKALKTNPYSGIKFNFTSDEMSLDATLGKLELAPFEKSEFVLSNSNSVNLTCPSQSSLIEVQKREVFGLNSTKETSLCVICQLKSQNNNTGKNITICSSRFPPFGNKTFLFTEHKLRNCTNCTIEEGTVIKSAKFCGYSFQSSKLTNLSVTNYTLCEEAKEKENETVNEFVYLLTAKY
jgi:hypothetical protein